MAHDINGKPRTKDVYIDPGLDFDGMLLPENILEGLRNNGFKRPSPIQIKAIPLGRCGFDMIMQAKSGTGKTIVFGIISLETVKPTSKTVQVIILVPTREIAVQIKEVLSTIGSGITGLNVQSFIGGLPIAEDIENLKKCHIAVGAPGRIKHLIELGHLKINGVQLLVLDEADKLVDSTFLSDVEFIFSKLPKTKQVIASSATYLDSVDSFLSRFMNSPTYVKASNDVPLLIGVRQFVSVVKSSMNVMRQLQVKTNELIRIISTVSFKQCLVFTNYQTRAESISNNLNSLGWATCFMSGNQSQKDRLKAISNLKNFKCRVLLSTDLTSRGIDVESVNLVINFDVPYNVATYLHRIGRAGRFGSYGMAITIAGDGTEMENFRNMISYLGDEFSVIKFPTKNMPSCIWNCNFDNFEKVYAKKLIQIDPRHDLESELGNLNSNFVTETSVNENKEYAEIVQSDVQNGNSGDKSDQNENVKPFEQKGVGKKMKKTQITIGTKDDELSDASENRYQKSELRSFDDILKDKRNVTKTEETGTEIARNGGGKNDDKILDLIINEFEKSELPEDILSFEDIKEKTNIKGTERNDADTARKTDVTNDDELLNLLKNEFEKSELPEKILNFEDIIKEKTNTKETEETGTEIARKSSGKNDDKLLDLLKNEFEKSEVPEKILSFEDIMKEKTYVKETEESDLAIAHTTDAKLEMVEKILKDTKQDFDFKIQQVQTDQSTSEIRTKELINSDNGIPMKPDRKPRQKPNTLIQTKEIADDHLLEATQNVISAIPKMYELIKTEEEKVIKFESFEDIVKSISQNGDTENVSTEVETTIKDDILNQVETFLKLSKTCHKEISSQIVEKYKHISPKRISKCLIAQQPITKRSSPKKSKTQSPKNVSSTSCHDNESSHETYYQSNGETPLQNNLSEFYSYDEFASCALSTEINPNQNQNQPQINSTFYKEFCPQNYRHGYDYSYHNVPNFYPQYNAYQNSNPNFAGNYLRYENPESNYLSDDSWSNMWMSQVLHIRKYVENVAICQQKIRDQK